MRSSPYMEQRRRRLFAKDFAVFLHRCGIVRFGEYTLASGKKSSFYVDLRLVSSYPVQFRRMIKAAQHMIDETVGLDSFDSFASVPTGGLVVGAALAIETVKPLVYVRSAPKEYGTSKTIEGVVNDGKNMVVVDDVATTGGSVLGAIEALRGAGATVSDVFVMVDRQSGAAEAMADQGIRMHSLINVKEIADILHEEETITIQTYKRIIQELR